MQDSTNESKDEAYEDAFTITSTLVPDTMISLSGLDQRSTSIRSGSQSSNAKRIQDYCNKSIVESDDAKDATDAQDAKGARNARDGKEANKQAAADYDDDANVDDVEDEDMDENFAETWTCRPRQK